MSGGVWGREREGWKSEGGSDCEKLKSYGYTAGIEGHKSDIFGGKHYTNHRYIFLLSQWISEFCFDFRDEKPFNII